MFDLNAWCREHPDAAAAMADEPVECRNCPAFVPATYDCLHIPVGLGFCAAARDWEAVHASADACNALCDALFDEVCRQRASATLKEDPWTLG